MKSYQIVLAGVGGQGILTLADLLGECALRANIPITGSETHGMAQRGGSVIVHLRFGDGFLAPLIADGQADMLIALEPAEALRYARFIKSNGIILTSINELVPPNISLKHEDYPPIPPMINALEKYTPNVYAIDFNNVLKYRTGLRSLNVAFLGSLIELWNYYPGLPISAEQLAIIIKEKWPKAISTNMEAYTIGQEEIRRIKGTVVQKSSKIAIS